jgi:hypothetical protein
LLKVLPEPLLFLLLLLPLLHLLVCLDSRPPASRLLHRLPLQPLLPPSLLLLPRRRYRVLFLLLQPTLPFLWLMVPRRLQVWRAVLLPPSPIRLRLSLLRNNRS